MGRLMQIRPYRSGVTLKMKMLSGLTAMLVLFLMAAMYSLQQVDTMNKRLAEQNGKVELKLMALELKEMVQELNIIASGLEISKKAEYIPKYNEKRTVFDAMIKRIGDTAGTPEQIKWRSQLIMLTGEYTNTFDVAAKLVQENTLLKADLDKNMEYLYNESQRLMNEIFLYVDRFYVAYSEDADRAIAETKSLMDRTVAVMWIASAFVAAAGATIAYVLVSSFSKPMRRLQQAVQRLASGDLRSRIGSESRDELGELSRSFDRMVDQVRSMLLHTQTIATSLSEHSTSFHRFSGSTAAANAEVIRAIEEISAGADRQAKQSEQSVSLIVEMEDELAAISRYSATIQQKSREAAFNTHTGSVSMEQLKEATESSEGVLDQVFAAMESLSASTVQIRRIVDTITEISHQTNVLALNASIEAARAGTHGRGFSVIAEEIRQLSAQTNESSKSIASIIRSLLGQTDELASSLGEARRLFRVQNSKMNDSIGSFQEIRASMDVLSQQIDHIQEQIALANDKNGKLVESVQFVAAIAQETAAGVEQVHSTSVRQDSAIQRIALQADDILGLSQQLFQEIRQFKMDEQENDEGQTSADRMGGEPRSSEDTKEKMEERHEDAASGDGAASQTEERKLVTV